MHWLRIRYFCFQEASLLGLGLWIILEVDQIGRSVISKLFLLVSEGNLLVLEKLGLLFMLVLGQQLLRVLLYYFLGIGVVLESLDKVFRLFGVDAGEMADVFDELLKKFSLEGERLLRDEGTGTEDDLLGQLRVGREKPPVDEAAVTQIRVFALLGDVLKEILQNFLAILRLVQIELHATNQDLLLDDIRLVLEIFHEIGHELISIIDDFDVLSDDPDDGGLGFGVIQIVKILTDISKQSLVLVGVLPEDIADDDDCLLNHVGNLGLEGLPQALDTLIGHFFQLDGTLAHRVDSLPHELHIDFVDVLLELV